jgi:rRNA processing protein Gar1
VKSKAPDIKILSKISSSGKVKILFGAGDKPYILIKMKKPSEKELIENVNFVLMCLQNPEI